MSDNENSEELELEGDQELSQLDDGEVLPPSDDTGEGELHVDETSLAPYDPLRRYLLEISRFKPLSREEEHDLAVGYRRTGDREAAYKLVTSNLRLVVKIAMIYHKIYRNILDLIQEGNVGLLQAVRKFDPSRGTRLPTYAAWWIKAYILKFLLDNTRMVKIGTTNTRRRILMNLNRQKRELEARGITPTTRMLADHFGVDEQEIIDVEMGMAGPDVSLDAPVSGSDGEILRKDTLELMEEAVDEKIAQGEFRQILERRFADFAQTLSPRERVILNDRLLSEKPRTLQEIADDYGITREAVRVAEKKLVAKIKRYMVESFGDVREIEFNLGR